jgi:hypothetical protein
MSRLPSIVFSTALISAGALAWTLAGRPLTVAPELDVPLNPLGINGSPYGEVLAMAMQSPINTLFHAGKSGAGHHHEEGEECSDCATPSPVAQPKPTPTRITPSASVGALLHRMEQAYEARTNPTAASEALRNHLLRQVENKLRFAYQLDPSHYGNYNSLNFFLTESVVDARPELTSSAAKLAEDTIQYCLKQNHDPRPALTAAAAATNVLQLMFQDRRNANPKFTTHQMRQYLALLDHCLARYNGIAAEWTQSKQWDLLSPQRNAECDERVHYIGGIRNAAEKTILRLEADAPQKTQDFKTQDFKTQDFKTQDFKTQDFKTQDFKTQDFKTQDARLEDTTNEPLRLFSYSCLVSCVLSSCVYSNN